MRFGPFPAALVISMSLSVHAWADGASSSTPISDRALRDLSAGPEAVGAQQHFANALALYRMGKYRPAVAELQAALASDPTGKDLVYNLALVQEKLGDYDGAIASLQRFESMEKDSAELERAAQTIERLQGARAELSPATPKRPLPPPVAPCPAHLVRGRFDAWVLGTGGLAVASLLLGTVFGVRALSLDPRGESTGANVSFADLRSRATRAHSAAVVADIAFSTSLLAGAASTTLYFGRYPDIPPAQQAALQLAGPPRVTAAWLEFRY